MPIPPERLADILDQAEDGIVTVDAGLAIVLFNSGAAKLFGYAPAEVLGRPLDLLLPPRFRAAHRAEVEAFGRSAEVARPMAHRREVAGRRKDGAEFPAEVSISKFDDGAGALYTAIVRDVTERKRGEAAEREVEQLRAAARLAAAEAEARESQAFARTVLDSLQAQIAVLDPGGRITAVNAAWEGFGAAHGADPARCGVGVNYLDVCRAARGRFADEAPRVEAGLRAVLAGAAPRFVLEYPCHWLAQHLWFLLVATPLGPDRRGVVVSHHDITERKQIEDALRETSREREAALDDLRAKTEELRSTTQQLWQAARLAGVGELAASIAHELNNPLATVSLRVEGVLTKTPPDDPRRRPLEVVEQEVERMAALVANLLQFSRPGRDQVSTVDVCEEVTRTLELTGHHLRKRGVRAEPEFAPGVPHIYADRQQLRQVFLNLFTNAADAMPAGGRLTPRVRPGTLPADRPAVVVEVADTGTGIPEEHLSRVTDPFFSTKPEGKGTGLGLAICKRIVHQHHGTLHIESRVGEGTTVRVTLPVRNGNNVTGLHEG